MARRLGFTLIELIVVIGVITLLLSILLPAVGRVWDAANAAKCQSNLKTLSGAFFSFAKDNDGHLPGSRDSYWADRIPAHWDWLMGQYSIWEWEIDPTTGQVYTLAKRAETAPQSGTIWPYVQSYQAYLCPSLTTQKFGTGIGSNGRYDYFAYNCFSGAPVSSIATYSQLHFALDPTNPNLLPDTNPLYAQFRLSSYVENHPTPLIGQEDSLVWINTYGGAWCKYCRQMSHCHGGGSYYAAIDGSINFINEPDTDPTNLYNMGARLWWQNGPQTGTPTDFEWDPGSYVDVNGNGIGWGWWQHMVTGSPTQSYND